MVLALIMKPAKAAVASSGTSSLGTDRAWTVNTYRCGLSPRWWADTAPGKAAVIVANLACASGQGLLRQRVHHGGVDVVLRQLALCRRAPGCARQGQRQGERGNGRPQQARVAGHSRQALAAGQGGGLRFGQRRQRRSGIGR